MSIIDEILASGRYTGRRGREWWTPWDKPPGEPRYWVSGLPGGDDRIIDHAEMRLLIERDMHRGECRGMVSCPDHPVPRVLANEGWGLGDGVEFFAIPPHGYCRAGDFHRTLPEAMDAARALAVES
ncbi:MULTISPECIES: hypothetical protein [unclassified Brevibacterium]|uniref:hypothetical protein n=1 Tax=unclassified Brevibacterium TaxID=2614124 RepID=UPI000C481F5B|nr:MULTISPECIES: hypothetical protein [unclassified Brevibacterium]SMX91257.1 hypothetical protein BSP239C_02263 [Brevibacterium sp. 239c]